MYNSRIPILILLTGLLLSTRPVLAVWGNDFDGGVANTDIDPRIACFVEFDGDLVAAGRFDQAGDATAINVARWDGVAWSAMGAGLPSPNPYNVAVNQLAVLDDTLYAVGIFHDGAGAPGNIVARWNGLDWESMAATIVPDLDSQDLVHCMIAYDGDLYIGGDLLDAGVRYQFARWAGDGWEFIPTPFLSGRGDIQDMTVWDDELWVVGGAYVGDDFIAGWDGETWTANQTVSVTGGPPTSICAHAGSLHLGGYFTALDGTPIDLLARWTGTEWVPGYEGYLDSGFWYSNGPEPSWVGCGIETLCRAGDRLMAGGLLTGSTAGQLYGKLSVSPEGVIEQLGGDLNHRVGPQHVMWGIVYALVHVDDEMVMGGSFNEEGDISEPLGYVVGEPYTPTTVEDLPRAAALYLPTPNPFNPQTSIGFSLSVAGPCRLDIYDLEGRLVRTLWQGDRAAGEHAVTWNGLDRSDRTVPSGVYMARLSTAYGVLGRKLVLAR